MEQAKLHLSAFLRVAELLGAGSTIAGLIKGNVVHILTAAGYSGGVGALPFGLL